MGNQRDNYWVILCKNTYLLTRFLYPQVKGIMKTSQINKAKGAGGQGGAAGECSRGGVIKRLARATDTRTECRLLAFEVAYSGCSRVCL